MSHPESVTFKEMGFRDVYWCPVLNEPTFLSRVDFADGQFVGGCDLCKSPVYPPDRNDNHPFICHIVKPGHPPADGIEAPGAVLKEMIPIFDRTLENIPCWIEGSEEIIKRAKKALAGEKA